MEKDSKEILKDEDVIKVNEGMETEVIIKVKCPTPQV